MRKRRKRKDRGNSDPRTEHRWDKFRLKIVKPQKPPNSFSFLSICIQVRISVVGLGTSTSSNKVGIKGYWK